MRVLSDYIPTYADGEVTLIPRVVVQLGYPDFASDEHHYENGVEWRVITLADDLTDAVIALGYEVL